MRRAIGLAVLLGLCTAAPTNADVDGNVNVYWTQQPRLVSKVPLRILLTDPGGYRATIVVSVAAKPFVRLQRDGQTNGEGNAYLDVPLTAAQRRAIAAAAAKAGVRPVVAATVTTGSGGPAEIGRGSARMRLAPFYDGSLRFPDAPKNREWSVSVDLPGEWKQLHGAMEGTYSPGSFSRQLTAGCRATLDVSATTARRPGRVGRGIAAVRTLRAPRGLPSTRRYVVVRATTFEPPACARSAARVAVRHAVRTAVVRHAAPTRGPGFDIF